MINNKKQRLKVLLIEDNIEDVRLIKEMLSTSKIVGFDLKDVGFLNDAIELLKKERFHAVLLDLNLPDSHGFDTFLKIKSFLPETPVVLLTGLIDKELGARAIKEGAQDYLVKGEIRSNLLSRAIYYASERMRIESALKESERKYREMVESLQEGVWVINRDAYTTFVNKKMADMLGYSPEEMQGRHLFSFCDEKNIKQCKMLLKRRHEGIYEEHDFEFKKKDGTPVITIMAVAPITDNNGNYMGAIAGVINVTEKRRMEADLIKAQKLKSIGMLAGGIAHDFNNALTAIRGNISLAKYTTQEEKTIELLNEAEGAIKRAKALTQKLITFSQGGDPIKKPVKIKNFLKNITELPLNDLTKTKISFSIAEDLWQVNIDEDQMNQVISNLLLNAMQAMTDDMRIEISAENIILQERDSKRDTQEFIKISIKDHGSGIPQGHLNNIYDPFFTTKPKANGLGLSIAYSVIKKHGGKINVDSEQGSGTTFHIYLPAFFEGDSKEKIMGKVSGMGRILVMDDEQMVGNIACTMLQFLGYNAELVKDGSEAIELFKKAKSSETPFDALILDLTIPGGMGGKETMKILRTIDPQVKAIVSSGYSSDPIMGNFKDYGFQGVITKPFNLDELNNTLNKLVKKA